MQLREETSKEEKKIHNSEMKMKKNGYYLKLQESKCQNKMVIIKCSKEKYCFKFLAASTIVMQKDLKHAINIIWASITIIYFVTLGAYYGWITLYNSI